VGGERHTENLARRCRARRPSTSFTIRGPPWHPRKNPRNTTIGSPPGPSPRRKLRPAFTPPTGASPSSRRRLRLARAQRRPWALCGPCIAPITWGSGAWPPATGRAGRPLPPGAPGPTLIRAQRGVYRRPPRSRDRSFAEPLPQRGFGLPPPFRGGRPFAQRFDDVDLGTRENPEFRSGGGAILPLQLRRGYGVGELSGLHASLPLGTWVPGPALPASARPDERPFRLPRPRAAPS